MKKRKLVVLSADAMIPEDVEYLSNKPFVQKILKEGVWINSLRTVYPANTYPCHASMITGCYPDKTGVDTNYYKGTKTWRAERDNIQVKTLIDYAKEIERLNKELDTVKSEIARAEGKLKNEGFVKKAPASLIEAEKAKIAKYAEQKLHIEETIAKLKEI